MNEDRLQDATSIVARYRWTVATLSKAIHWHSHRATRPFFRGALVVIGLLSIISGAAIVIDGDVAPGIFLIVFGLTFSLGFFDWSSLRAHWQFKRNLQKETEVEWLLSADKIVVTTLQARTETAWSALHKVVATPDGLLLFVQPRLFNFIPREGFSSDADFLSAVQLAKAHSPSFVYMDGKGKLPRIRFRIHNLLWTMLWVGIWAAAFAHLRFFVPSHRPLKDLSWPAMTIHIWIPLFFTVWTPPVALGALAGRTRLGIKIAFALIAVMIAFAIAIAV